MAKNGKNRTAYRVSFHNASHADVIALMESIPQCMRGEIVGKALLQYKDSALQNTQAVVTGQDNSNGKGKRKREEFDFKSTF